MIFDARRLPDQEQLHTDICVIGTGPAGSIIATELASAGFEVLVLESGGEEYNPDAQALASGYTSGDPTPATDESRQRQLGGTSHLWNNGMGGDTLAFRCGMLSSIDFEKRDWVAGSGWPFGIEELRPYYAQAQRAFGFCDNTFDGAAWADEDHPCLPFDSTEVKTSVWRYAPQRLFTTEYPEKLRASDKIRTYLFANVTELELNAAGVAVSRVIARTLSGNQLTVTARGVILAAGGLENPRILLQSRSRISQGLGNTNDLVGRFFMEHPVIYAGTVKPKSPGLIRKCAIYDLLKSGDQHVTGKLNLDESVLRQERLLHSGMALLPRHKWFLPDGAAAAKECLRAVRSGNLSGLKPDLVRRILKGMPYLAVGVGRKLTGNRELIPAVGDGPTLLQFGWSQDSCIEHRWQVMDAYVIPEQAPHRGNRVTLSPEQNALGCHKVNLHWEWRPQDADSVVRTQDLYRKAFQRSGVGTFVPERRDGQAPILWPGTHHHVGTTRMSANPNEGVVDENCAVHGVQNLFVAGCSVFPTEGYINPTFTIAAMAFRLAGHVRRTMTRTQQFTASASSSVLELS